MCVCVWCPRGVVHRNVRSEVEAQALAVPGMLGTLFYSYNEIFWKFKSSWCEIRCVLGVALYSEL